MLLLSLEFRSIMDEIGTFKNTFPRIWNRNSSTDVNSLGNHRALGELSERRFSTYKCPNRENVYSFICKILLEKRSSVGKLLPPISWPEWDECV